MYDALQVGPFTIQYFWIISISSFIATYFILDTFEGNNCKEIYEATFLDCSIYHIYYI
ncbi:hypothetical protein KDJ21_020350 [Metabacillus litoralis]|uniref:hypothetical protein n=1 Tax=Metabacillus litoralis TaxID=152268 RepID=UPI001E2F5454|nr:hypothetical protein [Metabacillus litoralis]UHA59136.1 hypothetical protein KDJ21_020350 [Metabacillus litoralis]